jgi:hypothetical protein
MSASHNGARRMRVFRRGKTDTDRETKRGPLGSPPYFVGGPHCVVNRYFYDRPMHRECAVYALESCPHLARSKGRYREPLTEIDGVAIILGRIETAHNADYFALIHTNDFAGAKTRDGMPMTGAAPWFDVEYWKHGKSVGPVPPPKEPTSDEATTARSADTAPG